MNYLLKRFEEALGAFLLVVMVTIAFLNVLTRYVFRYSMAFTEELTLYLFVWMVMVGASLAFREGSNMCVTLLYDRIPKAARKYIFVAINAVAFLFFCVLAYWGYREVMDEMLLGARTEALELPVYFFTGALPLISILILFRLVVKTYRVLRTGDY